MNIRRRRSGVKRKGSMEECQDPDSGYLNCIGVGDSYVRKQMERILGSGDFNAPIITRKFTCAMGDE